ncbi:MAG: GFA family protein [Pseudomonadales bacterium]
MCGAVKFYFVEPPKFVKDCVCESCRRAHGASAVCWLGVDNANFRLDGDKSTLKWYQSSKESERGFCVSCGTRVFFRSNLWPGETHMALACIDSPHGFVSTGTSFRSELPAWTNLVPKEDA